MKEKLTEEEYKRLMALDPDNVKTADLDAMVEESKEVLKLLADR